MSARRTWLALASVACVALAGCGEKPQASGERSAAKQDAAPFTGGESSRFASAGFKSGDKNAWAQHLKARAQNTQSDYTRVAN
jgi:hypothetical protein